MVERDNLVGVYDGTRIVYTFSAADASKLRPPQDFFELFRKTGVPDQELSKRTLFGSREGNDDGGEIDPSYHDIQITTVDFRYDFRKRFPTENGYVLLGGLYLRKTFPKAMILTSPGMGCGIEETNSAIDDFLSKSGLEEVPFPTLIRSRFRRSVNLRQLLENLRKIKELEELMKLSQ